MQPTNRTEVDILSQILEAKRESLARVRDEVPLNLLREQAIAARGTALAHRLREKLSDGSSLHVIAEFKRRSPSKGLIRSDVSATEMARLYERGGAAAISVLTEEDYFDGSLEDLRAVKASVSIPILRKDFIFDDYQIYESAVAGADAVLLIVAALDDDALLHLRRLSEDELGMDALVEVHTGDEMQRAISSGAQLVGINNRDLKSFVVSLETSIELSAGAPSESVLVAESGLKSHQDLRRLFDCGFKGFLIGEALMRAEHPVRALRTLINGSGQE